jgi:hypothetical protein
MPLALAQRVAVDPGIVIVGAIVGLVVWVIISAILLRAACSWVAKANAPFGIAILITFIAVIAGTIVNFVVGQAAVDPTERAIINLVGAVVGWGITGLMAGAMIRDRHGYNIGTGKGLLAALVQLGLQFCIGIIFALLIVVFS